MPARFLLVAVVVLVAGCSCSDHENARSSQQSPSSRTRAPAKAVPAEPAEAPEAEAAAEVHTAPDLRVVVNEDGTVTVSGMDRWGHRLDTTYADATYFRNALPVLRRAVTEAQLPALEGAVAELPPEPGQRRRRGAP